MHNKPVTNITTVHNVALITIDNLPNNMRFVSDIFSCIAQNKINIDMISQAPPFRGSINLSFSLSSGDLKRAMDALSRFKKSIPDLNIEVDSGNVKLSVYGEDMKNLPGVAAKIFTILAGGGIGVKLVTTSETDISYLISEKDINKAIEAIKSEYDISV